MLNTILSLFLLAGPSASNYDRIVTTIEQIAAQNPGTTKLLTIGISDKGIPIQALQIGNGPVNTLVVATHHGNEYGSTAVAMGVADALAKKPVDGQTVFVVPVLNTGGYNQNNRYESNLNSSFDPNRDYPGPCVSGQSYNLKSTKSLADFIEQKNIVTSATLHTFWPAVVYPWGISTSDLSTPNDAQFLKLTKAATEESHYQVGNNTEVLYPADGTFEDYAYWKHGVWSLLFELGFSHTPDQTAVKNMIDANIPGIRRFLEQAPTTRAAQHGFSGKCETRLLQRMWLE
ncbi:MAG: succinylglutamate desuccinylase/aspartoacylase family protein [Bdellovibrio sp.]|nr:succinylglutamate desuccinylase/aspartoacylase family protein [Bdellovibrio sp.]